jgi:hypothetical protein
LQLKSNEWGDMAFRFNIPGNQEPDTCTKFFKWLDQRGLITSTNLNVLKELMEKHGRLDLLEIINKHSP